MAKNYVYYLDEKLAFECDSFKEAYKMCKSYNFKTGKRAQLISENHNSIIFANAFNYHCIIYGKSDDKKTFALRGVNYD